MYNLSSVFWVYPGVSYQFDVPGKPPKEGTQEDPDQMPEPPQLAPFDVKEQRLDSELPAGCQSSLPRTTTETLNLIMAVGQSLSIFLHFTLEDETFSLFVCVRFDGKVFLRIPTWQRFPWDSHQLPETLTQFLLKPSRPSLSIHLCFKLSELHEEVCSCEAVTGCFRYELEAS